MKYLRWFNGLYPLIRYWKSGSALFRIILRFYFLLHASLYNYQIGDVCGKMFRNMLIPSISQLFAMKLVSWPFNLFALFSVGIIILLHTCFLVNFKVNVVTIPFWYMFNLLSYFWVLLVIWTPNLRVGGEGCLPLEHPLLIKNLILGCGFDEFIIFFWIKSTHFDFFIKAL